MSTRSLRVLSWLLVGALAGLAYAVSFEAIADYAGKVGWGPHLKYAAPLLVDTFSVVAMLTILIRTREKVRAVYAWSVLIGASGVSVALNIAHAPDNISAQAVSALPPVALLSALELVMSEARRSRSTPPAPARTPRRRVRRSLRTLWGWLLIPVRWFQVPPEPVQSAPESADDALAAELGAANAAQEAVGSRVVVRTLLAEDRDASVEAVMERAGIGRRRAYELLRQERAALNGSSGST